MVFFDFNLFFADEGKRIRGRPLSGGQHRFFPQTGTADWFNEGERGSGPIYRSLFFRKTARIICPYCPKTLIKGASANKPTRRHSSHLPRTGLPPNRHSMSTDVCQLFQMNKQFKNYRWSFISDESPVCECRKLKALVFPIIFSKTEAPAVRY